MNLNDNPNDNIRDKIKDKLLNTPILLLNNNIHQIHK